MRPQLFFEEIPFKFFLHSTLAFLSISIDFFQDEQLRNKLLRRHKQTNVRTNEQTRMSSALVMQTKFSFWFVSLIKTTGYAKNMIFFAKQTTTIKPASETCLQYVRQKARKRIKIK